MKLGQADNVRGPGQGGNNNSTAPAPDNSQLESEIAKIKGMIASKQDKGDYATADQVNGMVGDLQTEIGKKQPAGTYLKPTDMTNMVSTQELTAAVSSLNSAIDAKQPKGNFATKTEVQNVASVLETKQPVGNYALKSDMTSMISATDYAAGLKTLQDTIATKAARGETVNSVIITDSTNKRWKLRIDDAGVVITEEYNA